MTDTPADDKPGFVAKDPEHCHDCCRLIQAGETHDLTIDNAVLCPDCIRETDAIRLDGGRMVELREDRLLLRRGYEVVEALPDEVRHLADTLVDGRAGI